MSIKEIFEKYSGDYLKFDEIENKLSKRPDLHAFIMLDKIQESKSDIVSSACHDEIYLSFDEFNKLNESNIRDLRRCGVSYDSECDCLTMFT